LRSPGRWRGRGRAGALCRLPEEMRQLQQPQRIETAAEGSKFRKREI
jgi:hypothetical protein